MKVRLFPSLAAAAAAIAIAVGIFGARLPHRGPGVRTPSTPPPSSPAEIVVPAIDSRITFDGHLQEKDWFSSGRTGPFIFFQSKEPARPYSDARVMHDKDTLFIGLYAADDDQRRGVDAFKLAFVDASDGSILSMSISVDKQLQQKRRDSSGGETDWDSGVKFGVWNDGTLDDDSDNDEEWAVEIGIPLKSLGVTDATPSIKATFSRCDRPKHSTVDGCGAWGRAPDGGPIGILVFEAPE